MVWAHVRSIIPSLKLGDYLSVQAHKPCSSSHLYVYKAYYYMISTVQAAGAKPKVPTSYFGPTQKLCTNIFIVHIGVESTVSSRYRTVEIHSTLVIY